MKTRTRLFQKLNVHRHSALAVGLALNLLIATHLLAQPTNPAVPLPRHPLSQATLDRIQQMKPIFDGNTLEGWIQAPPYAVSFSGDDLTDFPALAKKLHGKADPISSFVDEKLTDAVKVQLAELTPASTNVRTVRSAFLREFNAIVSGPSLFEAARFQGVRLRPETQELRQKNPQGQELARLNRMLLEDAFPTELSRSPSAAWKVKDGAMSSLGAGRGVIYTEADYNKYRVVFTMRHLGGPPQDHAPCVLIFCTRPPAGERGLDALGGIQFQPPNGGSWDYRPGKNNSGANYFTRLIRPGFDSKEWHQVELLVDAETGTARMAVAQPVGTKAIEVLRFKDPTAGKTGPLAWQMHNKGLFDEFKDVRIETDPKEDRLITVE
jgi:hypothetical protein